MNRLEFSPVIIGNQPYMQKSRVITDTIVAVVLSILAVLSAESFNNSSPELGTLLRCVPAGIALIWLFRRCNTGYTNHNNLPEVNQSFYWYRPWTWSRGHMTLAPVQRNFPIVQHVPAQSNQQMHTPHTSRDSFSRANPQSTTFPAAKHR